MNGQLTLHKTRASIDTKIISRTPGRLRLRVAPSDRQPERMQRISSILESRPNISRVKTNLHQGSIVINHIATEDSLADVLTTLGDLGIIFAEITQGKTETASTISSALLDLNQRMFRASGGVADLRLLFPLGMGILSVRQLILKGWQLELIPWYVLAWYAFDSFIKLNINHQAAASTEL
ncbi:MAG TPA: hypothetical protein VK203_25575 [Nostocaceae cyanobacterium]|nr:hypothetical protein [Nostocaceae cyanobacterium]